MQRHCELYWIEDKVDNLADSLAVFETALSIAETSNMSDAIEKVNDAIRAADTYISSVNELFSFGEDIDFSSIRKDIALSNNIQLESFVTEMGELLKSIGKDHADLVTKCREASEKCTEYAESCSRQQAKAKAKKNKVRAVGGTTSAVFLGGGVAAGGAAASVFAGIFTFGIGTVVGLGLTAAAAGTVGAGVAVATHCTAHGFNKVEKSLRSVSFCFKDLASVRNDIKDQCDELHEKVENYERKHSILQATDRNNIGALCRALSRIEAVFNESNFPDTSNTSEKLKDLKKSLLYDAKKNLLVIVF